MTQQDGDAREAKDRAWTPPGDAEVAEILRGYDRAMDVKNANEEAARAVAENLRATYPIPSADEARAAEAGIVVSPSPGPVTSDLGGSFPGTALPSTEEIERDVAELRASRDALGVQVQSLVRAMARDARLRSAVAQAVDRGLDLGGKALEAAADRAPEILGRALGALLAGEIKAQLAR